MAADAPRHASQAGTGWVAHSVMQKISGKVDGQSDGISSHGAFGMWSRGLVDAEGDEGSAAGDECVVWPACARDWSSGMQWRNETQPPQSGGALRHAAQFGAGLVLQSVAQKAKGKHAEHIAGIWLHGLIGGR